MSLALALPPCVSGVASAQEHPERVVLRGVVHDADTFEPVWGVQVEVPGAERATMTDSLGAFALELPWAPGYVLYTTQIGYGAARVPVLREAFGDPVFVLIDPDPVMLEGLSVVVDRFETRRRSAMVPVRTIHQQDLERWAGRDMSMVLRTRVPFLHRCPRDLDSFCVYRRGANVRVTVCIDEMRAYGAVAQLAAYPPATFQFIEVYDWGTEIRAYTRSFVERSARDRRRLRPLFLGC